MFAFALLALCVTGGFGASVQKRQFVNCMRACSTTINSAPVCASNQHTYTNMCVYEQAACLMRLRGTTMSILHSGPCTSTDSSTTHCEQICDEDIRHVCATDGVVYQNPCLFQRAQCLAAINGTQLSILAYNDTCPKPRVPECEKYDIDTGDLAIEGGVLTHSLCPRLSSSNYVCGSDGHTYASECTLCQHMDTIHDQSLMIIYGGVCHSAYAGIVIG